MPPPSVANPAGRCCRAVLLLLSQLASGAVATPCTDASGEDGLNWSGAGLKGNPHSMESHRPSECAALCNATAACDHWTFHKAHGCSGHGEQWDCAKKGAFGCCFLKSGQGGPLGNSCTCSGKKGGGRLPPAPTPPPPPPPGPPEPQNPSGAAALGLCPLQSPPKAAPPGAKNVLYILVDDLRPSLSPYGQTQVHTPNIQKLAEGGMTFLRAYCQEAVCSPSRNSFLSGRRPDHTRAYNFINHFRQADTGLELADRAVTGGTVVATVSYGSGYAGECGSQCTSRAGCKSWTFRVDPESGSGQCEMRTVDIDLDPSALTPLPGATAGRRGNWQAHTSWNWTTLPELFRKSGYLTQGTGKVYHTEEGGSTSCWSGKGMPPNQDPKSWSNPGADNSSSSMFCVNCVAVDVGGCADAVEVFGAHGCADNADLNGTLLHGIPKGKRALCDKVIGDDALVKLQRAADNLRTTKQPFFLAVGFRKPHTIWRFPAPYLEFYPSFKRNQTDLALHNTLDPSVQPIAISSANFQKDPYTPMLDGTARSNRVAYYAAVSWMDHQVGVVMDKLEQLGLSESTVVALHSDHGWNLGEHGQWQKFTNWETGVRVPLIVRDPSLPLSHGKQSTVLAELVDIFPTLAELAGVSLEPAETIDGTSLAPALRDPSLTMLPLRDWALSQYPRCPAKGAKPEDYYEDNMCEFVERSKIPFMGYSLRVDTWRYTEWATWNGTSLRPIWSELVGVEMYMHDAGNTSLSCNMHTNACFDHFENTNLAKDPAYAKEAAALSAKLHAVVASQHP